jgi:hypothetical protein
MNRQIIPSMILSALIVAFFAILLYERDPTTTRKKPEKGESEKEAAASQSRLSSPGSDGSSSASQSPASLPAVNAETPSQPTASASVGRGEPAAGTSAPVGFSKSSSSTPNQDRAGAPVARDSKPTGRNEKSPPAGAGPSFGPGSPFTHVQNGETLRDVAVRIYGSPDMLDSLWRANRDVLPRKDSPLTEGTVLRTPVE